MGRSTRLQDKIRHELSDYLLCIEVFKHDFRIGDAHMALFLHGRYASHALVANPRGPSCALVESHDSSTVDRLIADAFQDIPL